jgi:hypothetical protein
VISIKEQALNKIESKIMRLAFDKKALKQELDNQLAGDDDMFIEFAVSNLQLCIKELNIYTYILNKLKNDQ